MGCIFSYCNREKVDHEETLLFTHRYCIQCNKVFTPIEYHKHIYQCNQGY